VALLLGEDGKTQSIPQPQGMLQDFWEGVDAEGCSWGWSS
jgi:hypothetical protein